MSAQPFTLTPEASAQTAPITGRVSTRAILLGLAVVCLEVAIITFSEPVARSSSMNIGHFPVGFFMWFVLAVLVLNPLLKAFDLKYALTPTELLTIGAVGLIGSHIPGSGLLGFFLGVLAAPYYFASPENRWGELLHPAVPRWLAPSNEGGTMEAFFGGATSGFRIPWWAWIEQLFWWMCLIGVLSFVLMCIAVVLRKQWVENERLVYPLISPISDLIEGSDADTLIPRLLRNKLFWIGFAIGLGILAWNMVWYFWDAWPRIAYGGRKDLVFLRGFPAMTNRTNLYIIGFGYFANVEVLFSLWFFYLVYWAQDGALNRIGYDLGPGSGTASAWQNIGALFALVVWAVLSGREHLRDVLLKAFGRKDEVDDRSEMLSYRTAVFGFVIGSVFCLLWLMVAGMQWDVGILLLVAMYVIYIGLAKVVCESGLLYLAWGVSPQMLLTGGVGSASMTAGSVTTMAFTEGLFFHGKGMFMSTWSNTAKMADLARRDHRRISVGMGLALLTGIPLCLYLSLHWGYEYGAYNFGGFPFRYGRDSVFAQAVKLIQSPEGPAASRLSFFGVGAVGMTVLTLLRYRLPWWPLHPIGFAVGGSGRATKSTWSIFIAWACKFLLLKLGGVTLYRQYRPVFTGLLTGYSLGVGISFLIDVFWFPGQGHWIHLY